MGGGRGKMGREGGRGWFMYCTVYYCILKVERSGAEQYLLGGIKLGTAVGCLIKGCHSVYLYINFLRIVSMLFSGVFPFFFLSFFLSFLLFFLFEEDDDVRRK